VVFGAGECPRAHSMDAWLGSYIDAVSSSRHDRQAVFVLAVQPPKRTGRSHRCSACNQCLVEAVGIQVFFLEIALRVVYS